MDTEKVAIFKSKEIRRIVHNNEWWFSVADVCGALVQSTDAGAYWRKLKQRLNEEGSQVVTNCHGLKLIASDGKYYLTDCANTEGIFRIIQSIPSPKAEPFKRWLAEVGYRATTYCYSYHCLQSQFYASYFTYFSGIKGVFGKVEFHFL